ncbi:hypothetical protein QUF79_18355 [Fictibacillus enclensis]|uniref:hypothetical protein n=1 Tax=Fictibacillus enclensis TaxID=1017270 RepID=UPI0025A22F7F|nr:hypothetical protein [Fictibacillus enclensis]MDM5199978.1 hypothetical protein [Fictibacillus enclensis]
MANDKKGKKTSNVVPLPNLPARLLEKGMASLKAKHYKESLSCFLQLLELDPGHPQGHLGVVLSLIELGQLQEAKTRAERMLKQGIGEYFDVLQIYLSILIQLSEYETVVSVVEAVLGEHQLPAAQAESFYQLLHFSRKMAEDPEPGVDFTPEPAEDRKQEIETLRSMLTSSEIHNQWIAMQQLSYMDPEETLSVYREFLANEEGHPGIKTMALNYLKSKNVEETVTLHKFGQMYSISIQELHDVYEEPFNLEVKKEVEDRLEQENPTLSQFALTIWWDYILAIYPQVPEPADQFFWSHALQCAAGQLSGMDACEELQSDIEIHPETLKKAVDQLLDIERFTFGPNKF